MSNQDNIEGVRHSLSHLMAQVVKEMWPGSLNAIGPVIEDGFYTDFEMRGKLSEDDLPKIEEAMRDRLKEWTHFDKKEVTPDEAREIFANNKYKLELIDEFAKESKVLTVYTCGGFDDLCKGGHSDGLANIDLKSFKLTRTAGAYWRGDEKNIMLTRIYGVAFTTETELEEYLDGQELAKERDHRKLGKEMDLFTFSPLVGKGLPLWTERGAKVRRLLERFVVEEEERRGYKHVVTPDIASIELFKTSGHYPYYKDSMYSPIDIDGEKFMLRPMTCPHHFELYLSKPRTYRELPMRIAEPGKLYRYEQSGELSGLIRLRSFTLADSHIVSTKDQASDEVRGALDLIEYCAGVFGFKKGEDYRYRLSLGDRSDDSKYFKDDSAWELAEDVLRKVLADGGEPFYESEAEAAFYGPKIDVQMKNTLGKEDTAFTVQYDFVMPKRFKLFYRDSDGQDKESVVIHRSSIGAIERSLAFLLEKTGGHLPFWLAPEQVRVLTINDSVAEYVEGITTIMKDTLLMEPLKYNELRYSVDDRNESLGKKIKEATELRIPVQLIVGPKDKEADQVSVRTKDGESKLKLEELKDFLLNLK